MARVGIKYLEALVAERKKGISLCGLGLLIAALGVWAAVSGCPAGAPPRGGSADPSKRISADDVVVRVRLGKPAPQVRVAIHGAYHILSDNKVVARSDTPLAEGTVALDAAGRWCVAGQAFPGKTLELLVGRDGTLRVGGRGYHGFLRLIATGAGIAPINVVRLEDYVAGVVTSEMPASFGIEPLKAQAIAARSYVMYERFLHRDDAWDVTDDVNSQVYLGVDADRGIGRVATDATRGVMVVYGPAGNERIFPTYFSSTCGGGSQSVRWVKPNIPEIPPLAGGVKCPWCAGTRHSDWGPIRLNKAQLWESLCRQDGRLPTDAGGRYRVTEGQKDSFDRLLTVRISVDTWSINMPGDVFRLAVGPNKMKSTLVQLQDTGMEIVLSNGHGWGHGMGLCQYGAGAMGQAGRKASDIVLFYYPGAVLKRMY